MRIKIILLFLWWCFFCHAKLYCQSDTLRVARPDSASADSIYRNITLEDILIKAKQVKHYHNKDVWTISKEMRKNTFDTYSLLNKIPGFYYDSFREKLSYWGRENILVTIDGMVKKEGYGGSLANMRFKKIEVYDHPEGRFAAYDVVVNLITYEDWQGYDVRGLNTATILPSSNYGNTLSKRNHDYTYTYTRPKFDVSSNLSYGFKDTRFLQAFDMAGNNLRYNSINGNDYTNIQKTSGYSASFDFDYKINKNHTISLKYLFSKDNSDVDSRHEKVFRENLLTGQTDETGRFSSRYSDVKDHTISAFYIGTIKKWKLNTELTHDIYSEKSRYAYSEPTLSEMKNLLDNKRKSWLLKLDAEIDMSKKGSLSFGYVYYTRRYQSDEELLGEDFTSRFIRNKGYVNLSYSLGKKLSVSAGVSAEHLSTTKSDYKDHQTVWGTNATLRYGGVRDKFSGILTYRTSTSYPTLYQTMTIRNQTEPLLSDIGNIRLKSSIAHNLIITLRWNRLSLNSALSYSPDQIMPDYILSDSSVFRSYTNIKRIGHSSVLSYQPKAFKFLGNVFQFRAALTYAGFYIDQSYQKKYVDYWGGQTSLSYDINNIISMQLGYTRMTSKSLAPQTVSQRAYDFWELQLSKDFLKRRIQCQLSYTLPIKWGIENMNYTDVISPFYRSYTSYNSFCYTKNQVQLRVVVRLADGHVVRKKFHEQTREKEIINISMDSQND